MCEDTDHPHIVKTMEILEDNQNYYVVMELMEGGDLLHKLTDAEEFSESTVVNIISQVLLALNYMHMQNIAHRDLKLDNIMCTKKDLTNFDVKLTDFGFAVFFDPDAGMQLALGSCIYMAPELCGRR